MRFSLTARSCTIAFALLAGCSASQNASTLPFSTAPALGGNATPLKLLELQAAGRMPGPVTPEALKSMLAYYESRPDRLFRTISKGTVAVWATNQLENYLIGLNSTTRRAVVSIDTSKNGGYSPIGVKVDHNQNVWVANEYNSSFNGGVVQEYSKDGTYKAGYGYTPKSCGLGSITSCFDFGYDLAEDSKYVFAGETEFYYKDGSGSSDYGSGVFRFTNGKPAGTSKYYPVSDNNSQLNCNPSGGCDTVFYMDVDGSGNIWFDFQVSGQPPAGLGELAANGTVSIIKPVGTYGFAGGVYVSNGGKVLNVTDQNNRETYQYHLPVTTASTPFNTIGPTKPDVEGLGDPVSGGFNSTDSKVVFGDAYGWIDRCTVSTNKCKAMANINFPGTGASGAAYTPSDK